MSDDIFYTVPQLAKELGVTPRAIRFYETKDLLAPKRAGNTRVYTQKDRARLMLILRGKRLGFSLIEIKDFLKLYESDPHHVEQVQMLVKKVRVRMADLEEQQAELKRVLGELQEIDTQCVETLKKAGIDLI